MEKKVDILAEGKPKTITLGDGKDYIIPAPNLTTLANVEQTLGYGLGEAQEAMKTKLATSLRDILTALLKENYPKMTADQVGRLVPISKIKDVAEIIGNFFSGVPT